MKNRLEKLYKAGRLSKEGLHFYVDHGLLTEEEYKEIIGVEVAKESEGAKK